MHLLFMLLASLKNVINLFCMLLTRSFKIFIDSLLRHPCYQNSLHQTLKSQWIMYLLYLFRSKILIKGIMVPNLLGSKTICQTNGCTFWNRFGIISNLNSEDISEGPNLAVTWCAQVAALLTPAWLKSERHSQMNWIRRSPQFRMALKHVLEPYFFISGPSLITSAPADLCMVCSCRMRAEAQWKSTCRC